LGWVALLAVDEADRHIATVPGTIRRSHWPTLVAAPRSI
jgi:hypothetical protein